MAMPPHLWLYAGVALAVFVIGSLLVSLLDALFMDNATAKIAAKMATT